MKCTKLLEDQLANDSSAIPHDRLFIKAVDYHESTQTLRFFVSLSVNQ